MNIGIINPYFDSLAGGERYTLTLASHWANTHDVFVFWDDPTFLKQASERLHVNLSKVKMTPNVFRQKNRLARLIGTREYDLLLFLSDGSIPTSFAKHNILVFQMPFRHLSFPFWKKQMYDAVIVYSNFTKSNIDPIVGREAQVIYPPVDTHKKLSKKKEKMILSVGRFTEAYEMKKQSVLINAFKKVHHDVPDWKFILTGGLLPQDKKYFQSLTKKAKNLPITLLPNISYESLEDYYQKASMYWHAAGFSETDPTLQEHFGISTVEAMAHGCIPIVYNGGGQKEIVDNGETGYLWTSVDELVEKTIRVAREDIQSKSMIHKIIHKSQQFDVSAFNNAFDTLLAQITS